MRTSLWLACGFLFVAACGVSSLEDPAGSRAVTGDDQSTSSEPAPEATGLDPSLAVMLTVDSTVVPAAFGACHTSDCGIAIVLCETSWSPEQPCGGRVCTGNICGAHCPKTDPTCIMSSSVQPTEASRTCFYENGSSCKQWQTILVENPRCNCVN